MREAAPDVSAEADDTRVIVNRLGVLLGSSSRSPRAVAHLPPRPAHRADVATLRRRLGSCPPDDALRAHLARRVVDRLPSRRLQALTDDPAGAFQDGRHEVLARAEPLRLGLPAAR